MSGYEKSIGALVIGDTIWLAVLTLYQYRTNTALKATLAEHEKVMKRQQGQIRELQEAVKNIDVVKSAVKELDDNLHDSEQSQKKKMKKRKEKIDLLEEQMNNIVEELKNRGFDVDSILEGDLSSLPTPTASLPKSKVKSKSSAKKTTSQPSTENSRVKRNVKSSRPTTPAKTKPMPEPHTETESEFDASSFVATVEKKRSNRF